MKRNELSATLAQMAIMGLAGGCGYTFGDLYLSDFGGPYAGIFIAAPIAAWAITATRADGHWLGYRQGHYDGRNGLFNRTDEIR